MLADGVKLLDTIENASDSTTPTNEILKIPDIIDKLISKEKDEWMLNYLKNISTVLVPYMLDSLASVTVLSNDIVTTMELLLKHNKENIKDGEEKKLLKDIEPGEKSKKRREERDKAKKDKSELSDFNKKMEDSKPFKF